MLSQTKYPNCLNDSLIQRSSFEYMLMAYFTLTLYFIKFKLLIQDTNLQQQIHSRVGDAGFSLSLGALLQPLQSTEDDWASAVLAQVIHPKSTCLFSRVSEHRQSIAMHVPLLSLPQSRVMELTPQSPRGRLTRKWLQFSFQHSWPVSALIIS